MKAKYIILLIFIAALTACINNDDGKETPEPNPIQRGDIQANRMIISFRPSSGGPIQNFEYYDPDGLGGAAPIKNDTWTLDFPGAGSSFKPYSALIKFYLDSLDVTSQIEDKGMNYIVCYREMNTKDLRINDSNEDANGLKLGTETTWRTLSDPSSSTNGMGNVKITLNYIHLRKEGICDGGIRIFESTINYRHQ